MFGDKATSKAYTNLILENNLYKENLKNHQECGSCFSCSRDFFNSILNSNWSTFSHFLYGILSRAKPNSPEALAFSTKIKEKLECKCSSYTGHKGKLTLDVKIPKLEKKTDLSETILSNILSKSGTFCDDEACKLPESTCEMRISSTSNLLISLSFQSRSSSTIFHFLQGLSPVLDLNPIFKSNQNLSLQGMILSNQSSSYYVSFNPFSLFSDSDNIISLDYFIFIIFQYSLIPSVLVYNSSNSENNLQEMTVKYEENIQDFIEFLSGVRKKELSLCFYCWNNSHDSCGDDYGNDNWLCGCGNQNPFYSMFCLDCNLGKRKITQTDPGQCPLCSRDLDATYCLMCSYLDDCVTCGKKIYNTQLFVCLNCGSWNNNKFCKCCECDTASTKIQCFDCSGQKVTKNALCHHGTKFLKCENCLFDYICGSCHKPQILFTKKFCYKCRSSLSNNFCSKCSVFVPLNSQICPNCLLSSKRCHSSHYITDYSVSNCSNCKLLFNKFCNICDSRSHKSLNSQCSNCKAVLSSSPEQCSLLSKDSSSPADSPASLCLSCKSLKKTCKCGSIFFSPSPKCPACTKSPVKFEGVGNEPNDWDCKICRSSNLAHAVYCEYCNSAKDWVGGEKPCKVCKFSHHSETCLGLWKVGSCACCFKDMLISQQIYCGGCKGKVLDRLCSDCKWPIGYFELVCVGCKDICQVCKRGKINAGSQCAQCSD